MRYITECDEKYKVKKDDIIIVRYGAVGSVSIGWEGAIANNMFRIRLTNKNRCNPKYISYLLCSSIFKDYIQNQTLKSSIPAITHSIVKDYEIPLPPLEVQEEIVKELDGYQAVIDGAQKVIDNWKPTLPINPEWEKVKLSDFVTYSQGVQIDLDLQVKEPREDFERFLRIENYTQKSDDFRYIPKEFAKNKFVSKNDIVIVRYGATAGFIGKGHEGVLANNLFVLNIKNQESIMEDYLYYALLDEKVSSFIRKQAFGGGMPALSFKIMDLVEIYLPSVKEQQEIVSKIQKEEQAIEQCRKLIEIHKQKINEKIKSIWNSEI